MEFHTYTGMVGCVGLLVYATLSKPTLENTRPAQGPPQEAAGQLVNVRSNLSQLTSRCNTDLI